MNRRIHAHGLAACVLFFALRAPGSAQDAPAGNDAAVFIRVIGDLHVEYKRTYRPPVDRRDVDLGTGTGFVLNSVGLILTNNHVVSDESFRRDIENGEAETSATITRIEAVLRVGGEVSRLPASVVATDAEEDLALLSVTASDLPYVPLGDSDALDPGQPVRVLGFPFGGRLEVGQPSGAGVAPRVSVSPGSISARRENATGEARYLQTDANLNPGNSGGPMLDADGFAQGVVRMKLTRGSGIGFTIPINRVKDFLERNGFAPQIPAHRLRLSAAAESFDAKGFRLRYPEAWNDESPSRLRFDSGASGETVGLAVDRIWTPWDAATLEQALLSGREFPGFSGAAKRRVEMGKPARVLGSARGSGASGDENALWMEYAVVDLGKEKLVARYVGPPAELAFNLSLIRASLESLEASPLLTDAVKAPLSLRFQPTRLGGGSGLDLPVPEGFWVEAVPGVPCPGLAAPEAGLSASPRGDFTVSFRASWQRQATSIDAVTRACAGRAGVVREGGAYAYPGSRFGASYATEGLAVRVAEGVLRLEVEAPTAKLPFVRDLFLAWARASGAPGH